MISPEISEKLGEAFRQVAVFIIVFLGTLLATCSFLIALGVYFLHKSKSAEGTKNKKIFKILAIICWTLASLIMGYVIWLYIS